MEGEVDPHLSEEEEAEGYVSIHSIETHLSLSQHCIRPVKEYYGSQVLIWQSNYLTLMCPNLLFLRVVSEMGIELP